MMYRMRIIAFLSVILLFSCSQSEKVLDDRQLVLTPEFSGYDNFFPLATLDLSDKGIKDKIHVMYVDFDPGPDYENVFPKGDYIDEFSFRIRKDGTYQPTFKKSALVIGKDFEGYFKEDLESYRNKKMKKDLLGWIDITDKPRWWQYDQTPKNSKGKPMKFICQVDMGRILINDDCRLFVFYDEGDRIVKYVYQRT
jgi:hypothetical protein